MNLIIDAELTEPPSEVSVFRDVTLYADVFLDYDILLECMNDMKDMYWYWLKRRGAFDFIEEIIESNTEYGVRLGPGRSNIRVKYLRAENLNFVITRLRAIS